MCGIAGYATIGTEQKIDPTYIDQMLTIMTHRGPDDAGSVTFPQVALGNRRLSIIDLAGGHQPIYNEDGSIVVVYNGEMYNFPELRQELERKGHVFSTNSDTEVLVHLYEEEGPDFVKRLNAMFSFALYDQNRQRLIIGRDRFGVKPLFYTYQNGCLSFASEIKSLKILPDFAPTLDPEAMAIFLDLYFIPDPWTIYQNVRRLKPGHYLMLSPEGFSEREYYDFDYTKKIQISQAEAEQELANLFRQAVQRQLIADVPVGVLLSGGMDSRSVLAAASEKHPEITTFTVTFDEKIYDEDDEASLWSRLYRSPHKTLTFSEAQFCQGLLSRQNHLDQPHAIWMNVAMEQLAHMIRESGFKVVLSGQGGDELFCGYPTIHAANIAQYYRWLPSVVRERMIKPAVQRLPAQASRLPLSFQLKSFVDADNPDIYRNFFGFKEVIRPKLWPGLLTPEGLNQIGSYDPFVAHQQHLDRVKGWHLVDALSYLDSKVFMPGNLFVGGDNAFMAASVEQRVPFLDNDLVDFACQLPVDLRFHPLKPKVLLRNAFKKHFPPPTDLNGEKPQRYRKSGFAIPSNIWLQQGGQFATMLQNILSPQRLGQTGFFRPEAVQKLLQEQMSMTANHERVLATITSLVLFLDGTYDLS